MIHSDDISIALILPHLLFLMLASCFYSLLPLATFPNDPQATIEVKLHLMSWRFVATGIQMHLFEQMIAMILNNSFELLAQQG